jgi:hypothetical protein
VPSAPQDPEDVLELHADLADDLLTLTHVGTGLVARQALPRPADRESFVIQKASNLADDQNILALIVTTIAAPLDGLELRELLFPIAQRGLATSTLLTLVVLPVFYTFMDDMASSRIVQFFGRKISPPETEGVHAAGEQAATVASAPASA